jgi:hypothetical protein
MQDVGWEYLVFPGDGEMVRQMREYPWQEPALGDPRDWSSQVWSEIWDTIGPWLGNPFPRR